MVARLTKFTLLDFGADKGEGDVVATKALKASSKILRRSSGVIFEDGSIPKAFVEEGKSPETGSVDSNFNHDANLSKIHKFQLHEAALADPQPVMCMLAMEHISSLIAGG